MNRIRRAGNKGRFYPADASQIDDMIYYWNSIIEENIKDKSILNIKPTAIISPHAGYIFSGFTANIAHRVLSNSNAKRIIVIGPSHHVYIKGISISEFDKYETPYGYMDVDMDYIRTLKKEFEYEFESQAHFLEHSTETQMPFIKKNNPEAKIVEMIYGNIHYKKLYQIIKYILKNPENAIVISSDLSHFHNLETAESIDQNCLTGVANKNLAILNSDCEACGITGIIAIIDAAIRFNLKTQLLDYRTSADASKDEERVVGYMSATIY
jgi:AmmeMemoRadiSam system protein B